MTDGYVNIIEERFVFYDTIEGKGIRQKTYNSNIRSSVGVIKQAGNTFTSRTGLRFLGINPSCFRFCMFGLTMT